MIVRFFLNKDIGTASGISISPFNWDVPATRLFVNSLSTSVLRQFASIREVARKRHCNILAERKKETVPYPEVVSSETCGLSSNIISVLEKKERLDDFNWGDGETHIMAYVYHTQKNGRCLDICKIGICESSCSQCSVRIANIIPDFARVVYAVAYLLKALPPPRGFDCLRNINLIKDFTHFNDHKERLSLVRNKDGSPKEVVLVQR